MDPITAAFLATKAIAEMITELAKGQTPEQRAKFWEWFEHDQERWRKLLKLDA